MRLVKAFGPQRYAPLLLAFVAAMALAPGLDEAGYHRLSSLVTLPVVLMAALMVLSGTGWLGRIAVVLFLVSVVLEAIAQLPGVPTLAVLGRLVDATFLALLLTVLLKRVLSSDQVELDTILGGICGYLTLGFFFIALFALAEILQPGSFLDRGQALSTVPGYDVRAGRFPSLTYHSFVTLTTLGYGDVTPQRALARSLCGLAALAGQLYVAVLIAVLVSRHLVDSRRAD